MMREILTLILDKTPVQYYILFTKERNRFIFEPTLKNKSAPKFTIEIINNEPTTNDIVDDNLLMHAKEKVREIISDDFFDKL
jgi:hypothetical protein